MHDLLAFSFFSLFRRTEGNAKNPRSCTAELGTHFPDIWTRWSLTGSHHSILILIFWLASGVLWYGIFGAYVHTSLTRRFFTANHSNHTDYLGPGNPHLTVFSECVEPAYRNLEWREPNCVLTHPHPPLSLCIPRPPSLPPHFMALEVACGCGCKHHCCLRRPQTTPLNPWIRDNLAPHYRHYVATKGDANLLLRPPINSVVGS
jgi:hypothetical protein